MNMYQSLLRLRHVRHKWMALLGMVLMAAGLPISQASAADTIRFGAPSWPGVTVKTQVAAQILEAMGYDTDIQEASPTFIITGLKSHDMDVYLGGWMPTEEDLINPPRESGEVEVLATNISGATMGIAVPSYVWDAGVHKVTDLNKFADKFDHKIYGIEDGSGFNNQVEKTIEEDRHDLGDWELIPSTTSIMLSQVKQAIKNEDWIIFLGWEPHWMNLVYDMAYIEPVGEPLIAGTKSDVLTVVNPEFAETYPNLKTFFSQFVVTNDEQSEWILEFSHNERPEQEVAADWIRDNMDRVDEWLEGVTDKDDKPAIDAVHKAFSS